MTCGAPVAVNLRACDISRPIRTLKGICVIHRSSGSGGSATATGGCPKLNHASNATGARANPRMTPKAMRTTVFAPPLPSILSCSGVAGDFVPDLQIISVITATMLPDRPSGIVTDWTYCCP
jgi:hypothetical protein